MTMRPTVVLAPTGCLGCMWDSRALVRGMSLRPHVVAVDAGSSDSGPYYLGTGKSLFSPEVIKPQLHELLAASRRAGIPLIVGSAGTAGARPQVDKMVAMVREIAAEEGHHFKLAWIYADVEKARVKRAIAAGEVRDFEAGFPLTAALIDQTIGLVAQMGYEPIIDALSDGADVIVAGRACDDMVIAAYPIWKGHDPALAIHMGKILECGAFAADPFGMDVMLATLDRDHFVLEPGSPRRRATVRSVAGHSLYEREDPFEHAGPGGTVDLSGCTFEQLDDRRVRVSGARLDPGDAYWVKLEGARRAGFRSSVIMGIRCPTMIERIDEILKIVGHEVAEAFSGHTLHVRFLLYGRDAVMGELEPRRRELPHEIGLLVDVVADNQDLAHDGCNFLALHLQHIGYEGQVNNAANVAFPYSPREQDAGPIYDWSVYHLMRAASARELFPLHTEVL